MTHTSESSIGQIYVPSINGMLLRGGADPGISVPLHSRTGIRLRHGREPAMISKMPITIGQTPTTRVSVDFVVGQPITGIQIVIGPGPWPVQVGNEGEQILADV